VPLDETISSFEEIVQGKADDIPESLFLMTGNIDEVREKHREMQKDG
jgi:F-type H+-transporting ATPase subunit beta